MLCVLLSCNGHRDAPPHQYFVFNQSAGLNSLDPVNAVTQAEIWAVSQFYNGLLQTDSAMLPSACIARGWTISPNGLDYTFHLRSNVYFRNDSCFSGRSRKIIASDVVFSLQRLMNPSTAAKGSWVLTGRLDSLKPFTIIDDTTLIIRLRKPFAPFLNILTMPYCYIIPHEAVKQYGSGFMKHPVGTGPFMYLNWRIGDVLIGKKNPQYFECDKQGHRLPYIQGFSMTQVENKKTEYLKFIQGDIDMMADVDASFKDELLDAHAQLRPELITKFQLLKNTFLNTEYIGLNIADSTLPIIHNTYFRQALASAIDKNKMLLYLRNNVGHAANGGFVPDGIPGFGNAQSYGWKYNTQTCHTLLLKAGYKGQKITLSVSTQNQALAEYIVKAWQDAGINAALDVLQAKSLRDKMVKGKMQAYRGSWIADYADPENFLACFYGMNSAPPNYTRYKNPTYDKLYETVLQNTDIAQRNKQYHILDSMVTTEAIVIPLFYDETLTFLQKDITGFKQNAQGNIDLRYVYKSRN